MKRRGLNSDFSIYSAGTAPANPIIAFQVNLSNGRINIDPEGGGGEMEWRGGGGGASN